MRGEAGGQGMELQQDGHQSSKLVLSCRVVTRGVSKNRRAARGGGLGRGLGGDRKGGRGGATSEDWMDWVLCSVLRLTLRS